MKKNIILTTMLVSSSLLSFGGTTIIYPQTQTYIPQQTTVVIQPSATAQTVVVQQPTTPAVVVQQPTQQTVYVEPPTTTEVVIGNIAPIIRAITPFVIDRPHHHPRPHYRPIHPRPHHHRIAHRPPPRVHVHRPMPPRR